MRFIRFIVNLFYLAIGVFIGIVWGAHHPAEAANLAQQEHVESLRVQVAVSGEKIKLLQQSRPAATQEISDEQAKLDAANKELSDQPTN